MVRKLKACGWKPKFESQEFDGYTEELDDEVHEEKRE